MPTRAIAVVRTQTALAACGFFIGACSPTSSPVPQRLPTSAPSIAAVEPDDAACVEAKGRVDEATQRLHPDKGKSVPRWRAVCAPALLEEAMRACPSLVPRAQSLDDEDQERARLESSFTTTISADERWILQQGASGNARIWERTSQGVKLVNRLRFAGNLRLERDDRAVVIEEKEAKEKTPLAIVDLASQSVTHLEDVSAYQVIGTDILVATATTLRRYSWPALVLHETVPMMMNVGAMGNFRSLRAGRRILFGDAMISLDDPRVLAQGYDFEDAAKDESRIAACTTGDRPHIVVLDTDKGARLFDFDVEKSPMLCTYAHPTLTADGRFVVDVERTDAPDDSTNWMTVVVFDVSTKKITRFVDKSRGFGSAEGGRLEIERAMHPRVCIHYGNMHWVKNECPWTIDDQGRIGKSKDTLFGPKTKGPKLTGDPLATAMSPDGKTRVVMAMDATEDHYSFLHPRLLIVDEITHTLRKTVSLGEGKFAYSGTSWDTPTVRYLDATHVLYDPVTSTTKMGVLDVTSGDFRVIDGAAWEMLGSRYALSAGTLIDLITQASYPMQPSQEDFKRAPELRSPCPFAN